MPCASAEIPASTAGTTTEAMLIMTVMMLCTIGMTAWMAEPMICIAVIMAEPRPLMMPAIDGAAAVKVCRMMGTTVPVRKLKMSWMIGFTVACAKLTICPTTPITDCRMVVSPSKAAPASSPNRFVMVSPQRGQRICHAAVRKQSRDEAAHVLQHAHELVEHGHAGIAEYVLDDAPDVFQVVAQDAHHGDDGGDHADHRRGSREDASEAGGDGTPHGPQHTGSRLRHGAQAPPARRRWLFPRRSWRCRSQSRPPYPAGRIGSVG